MGWKIKQRPEDFIVREILPDELRESWNEKLQRIRGVKTDKEKGRFLWMTMKKTGIGFFEALDALANALGMGTSRIGYAGVKDKHAVTYQTISIEDVDEKAVEKVRVDGLELSGFRHRKREVRLGEHDGNHFTITVRNVGENESHRIEQRLGTMKREGMVNFFGAQRFGDRDDNHIRGLGLIRGEYKSPKRTPLRLQKLFVHAYQAHIWNAVAEGLVLMAGLTPSS